MITLVVLRIPKPVMWPARLPVPDRACRSSRFTQGAERRLRVMTAQPMEDPSDPLVILRDLPERERDEFLNQYRTAVDAARDPAGYEQLRRMLHVWSLAVVAASQPGYYEELAAVRDGIAPTVPVIEAIPDWARRVASARDPRR